MSGSNLTNISLPDIGKPLVLFASFVMSLPAIAARVLSLDSGGDAVAYIGLLVLIWIGVIGAAWSRYLVTRLAWAVLLPGGLILMDSYRLASGQFLTYDTFITLLASSGSMSDALAQNGAAIVAALVPAIILALAIILPPRPRLPLPRALSALFAPLAFGVLTVVLFVRGGDGGRGLPEGMTATSYLALAGFEEATDDDSPRRGPLFQPARDPAVKTLVLVIDESIAPTYLAPNARGGIVTPLARPPEGVAVHDFGIAAAVNGCSVGSNRTLRHGGTRANFPEMNARYPSLWEYAQAAGMRTVYIDAQSTGGAMHSGMDDAERAFIDEFIQYDDAPIVDRDMRLAADLVRITRDSRPTFAIVNKMGAHFPVHDKYPLTHLVDQPVLARGDFGAVAHTGDRSGFAGTPDAWRKYRNAYRNTLRWNVGEFFERVFSQGDMSDTLMIYTADHGQYLHEDGQPGTTTHCVPDPAPGEGAVPLFVIQGADAPDARNWRGAARANHDKASHFMIAPALLDAMGYDRRKVAPVYGASLLRSSADPMTFAVDFNARLGREPRWRKLDTARVPAPPPTD